MARMIFPNLPVTDLAKATDFYTGLGFEKNPQYSNEVCSAIVVSDSIVVMLLQQEFFKGFLADCDTPHLTSDAKEVLNCLSCDSREEVDSLVQKARDSGGTVYHPAEEGTPGMYAASVADPDGHIWELLYMSPEAMAGQEG
jgi:uncharacterized protein